MRCTTLYAKSILSNILFVGLEQIDNYGVNPSEKMFNRGLVSSRSLVEWSSMALIHLTPLYTATGR